MSFSKADSYFGVPDSDIQTLVFSAIKFILQKR